MATGLRWPSKDKERDRTAWARAAGPHSGARMQESPFESGDQRAHQAWSRCERVLSGSSTGVWSQTILQGDLLLEVQGLRETEAATEGSIA